MQALARVVLPACAMVSSPAVGWSSLERACAAFDLHILVLLDETAAVAPRSPALVAAADRLLQARAACRAHDAAEAMRLYATIDLPRPSRAAQPIPGMQQTAGEPR